MNSLLCIWIISCSLFFYLWWYFLLIFFWDYTVQLRHSQCTHTHTHTPMNTRTQTLPLWASSKTEPKILEIDEVTTGASLSTGTSPTTECTTPLNPRIFAPMRSRTQDLRCYRDSYNHYATDPFTTTILLNALLLSARLVLAFFYF